MNYIFPLGAVSIEPGATEDLKALCHRTILTPQLEMYGEAGLLLEAFYVGRTMFFLREDPEANRIAKGEHYYAKTRAPEAEKIESALARFDFLRAERLPLEWFFSIRECPLTSLELLNHQLRQTPILCGLVVRAVVRNPTALPLRVNAAGITGIVDDERYTP